MDYKDYKNYKALGRVLQLVSLWLCSFIKIVSYEMMLAKRHNRSKLNGLMCLL